MPRHSLGFLGGSVAVASLMIAACNSTPREAGSGTQNGTATSGDASAAAAAGSGAIPQGTGGTPSAGGTTSPSGVSGSGTAPTGTGGSPLSVLPDTGGTSGTGGASSAPNGGGTSGTSSGGADAGSLGSGGATGGALGSGGATGGAPGAGGTPAAGGSDIRPVTCAPDGALSKCGNGVVDPGEQCDGADLRGLSCTTVDPFFTGGTLACNTSCTLETGHCTHGTCGNGVIDPGEDCEYENFGFPQCKTLPNVTGDALVECSSSTCRYNLSNCSSSPAPVCGNGIRESGEQCDGEDWLRRACTENSMDYTGGRLSCDQATCQLNLTQCTRCDGSTCGDGVIDPNEQCDGTNLGTHSCLDQNRLFGTVSCLPNCNVDYSKCPGCTIIKGRIICN